MEITTSENKPIYAQVTEYCLRHIDNGSWAEEKRIPSTKELAVNLKVNHRTVMKAYDELARLGLIYQERGQGYYVSRDAPAMLAVQRRDNFRTVTLPAFMASLEQSGYSIDECMDLMRSFDNGTDTLPSD